MIKSGFPRFDKVAHGFEEGRLYVIADKVSLLNNSVIGANLAYKMSIENINAMLYFSLASNNAQKAEQLISIKSGISKERLKEGLS